MYIRTPSETKDWRSQRLTVHEEELQALNSRFFSCTYEPKSLCHPLQGESALLALHWQHAMTQVPDEEAKEEADVKGGSCWSELRVSAAAAPPPGDLIVDGKVALAGGLPPLVVARCLDGHRAVVGRRQAVLVLQQLQRGIRVVQGHDGGAGHRFDGGGRGQEVLQRVGLQEVLV